MKIYLDLIFFINFMFDFLLLMTVNIVLKRNIKLRKIILGSFIGALSIFLLFIKLNSFTLFLLKVLISIFMIISTFGIKNKKYFYDNILYLYTSSIILGGFLYFINNMFSYKNKGILFIHNGFSINLILIILLTPIILFLYIKQSKDLKNKNTYLYKVEFRYKNKIYRYSAYLDTGNFLTSPYSNSPIIIVYDDIKINNPLYIPYSTIDNSGVLKGFKINKITIDNRIINKKIIIALSNNRFNIDGVNMILNKKIFD